MKLFLVIPSLDIPGEAIVAAPDEATARTIDPRMRKSSTPWTGKHVKAIVYIGQAVDSIEQGVLCTSYEGEFYNE